jgi:hypothetical protein
MDIFYRARVGEKKGTYRVLVGNLREGEHLEDPGVYRIILKCNLEKLDRGMDWIDLVQDGD